MPQDRELERYLQGNDPLSRAYDSLRSETPSPELDSRVLLEARTAVSRTRRFPAWQSYTAIAATVVVAFAVGLRFDFDQPLKVEVAAPARAPAAQAPYEPSSDTSSSSPRLDALLPAEETVLEAAPIKRSPVIQGTPVYTIQADDLGEPKRAESQSRAEQDSRRAKAEVGPTKEAAAVGGGTGARLSQPGTPMDTAIQASAPAELRNRTAPPARETAVAGQLQGVSIAATPAQERQHKDHVNVSGSRIARQPLAPEPWLHHIEQLRKDGKLIEAEAEMRRFQQTYPSYGAGLDAAPTK